MKGVIYARYSSDNQREESIEGQLRECLEFAEKNDIIILGNYIDRAMSAKTDNRPEFQRMMKDSDKGLFDIVLVWKLDRFARNRYDSAFNKSTLRKNGVKVVSATEKISEGSEGILLESLLEGMAEYFSVELAEKVTRGMTENALKCKYNGGTILTGYQIDKDKHYCINPLTAPIVLEVFTMYAEGKTVQKITSILADRGVRTSKNKLIGFNSVARMLKNRKYIGEYSFGDVVVPDGMPAIVPLDLFERVQEKMVKNKKAPARYKAEDRYILTTKLFCGYCGAYMVGESGTSKTGIVHRYYKCATAKRQKKCSKKTVQKYWIEKLVVDEIIKIIFDDDKIGKIVKVLLDLQKKESIIIPSLNVQLSEVEKGIENMLNAIQQGVFTSSTKERLEKLEDLKSQIKLNILHEQMAEKMLSEEEITFWLHKFRDLDISNRFHRQRLVDSFINAIYLYDDKIILTFNAKEGDRTITLEEIEYSDISSVGSPYNNKPTVFPVGKTVGFVLSIPVFL